VSPSAVAAPAFAMHMRGIASRVAPWPLLVTPSWLAPRLADKNIAVLDCSWYLPAMQRNARAEFAECAIPGARFFDVDENSDPDTWLPHMLPDTMTLEENMTNLGVEPGAHVICYDGAGIFSAPRVWWMLSAFGYEAVSVLDGGLPAWKAAGYPVEPGGKATPLPDSAEPWKVGVTIPTRVKTVAEMQRIVANGCADVQVVDARSAARFAGTAPEPRPGLSSGHMPGARNLPFANVLKPVDGTSGTQMADIGDIEAAFLAAKVDVCKPFVATCGSGMTACVLALGAAHVGNRDVSVYDGSWTEWAFCKGNPIEKDPGSSGL